MSEVFSLGEVVRPNRPRVKPELMPKAPFIGMEHVEAHTMKLLGTVPAATMKSSAVHFKPGDVLYGRLRPYLNKVFRPTFEGLCSAEFIVFPENERIDGRYLQYFLNSGAFLRFATHLNAGDRPRVDFDQIAPYKIPVPTRARQREIVAELEKQFSRLDEAVANLQRVKTNLKRYRASVLKAAVEGRLVETEATQARREGRTYETGEQLLQRILEERQAQWAGKGKYKEPEPPVLDGLSALPDGWVHATTEQMCEQIASGSTPSPEAMFSAAGDVPFLKVYNLTFDGSLDFTLKPTFVSNATHQGMLARSRSIPGDVLMNIVGPPLGKVSIVPTEYPEWNINQAIVTFRPSSGLVNQLLAHWLLARPVLSRLERTAKATAGQHNLQVSTCRKLPIPVPPLAEQARIVVEVDRHLSIIREVEAEVDANLKRAQALRQSVLQRAFSGEMRVAQSKPSNQETQSTMVVARLLEQGLEKNPNIGRTMLMKMAFLAPLYAQIEAANDPHTRIAAGPANLPRLEQILSRLQTLGWYREKADKHPKNKQPIYSYEKLSKADECKLQLGCFTAEQLARIDQVAKLLRGWTVEQCELLATVYAAWNDLLIAGREVTSQAVVHELHTNWHQSKERFSAAKISAEMDNIRKLGMTPTGFGAPTSGQAADTLSGHLFES
jgi:type I restriction enzyme, S subunit